jgi:hypothetical protein
MQKDEYTGGPREESACMVADWKAEGGKEGQTQLLKYQV